MVVVVVGMISVTLHRQNIPNHGCPALLGRRGV